MTQDTSDTLTDTTPAQDGTDNVTSSATNDELVALREEIAQLKEQVIRSQADYSNLVRRSREEQGQIGEWAENKIILKFLPVLDNLERAVEHTPEEFKTHSWTEGLYSIIRSFQKVISDLNVQPMSPLGQEIHPDFHEVISQIPHESTTIQAEIEKGYTRGAKTLRHAKVIVGDGSLIL